MMKTDGLKIIRRMIKENLEEVTTFFLLMHNIIALI